jgi:hypothetical protein
MSLCLCTVKRDPDILNPAFLNSAGNTGSDQGAIGAERSFYPPQGGMIRQLPDILAHQGLPTGEQNQRNAHAGKVIDEAECLGGRQLSFCPALRIRMAVTVFTGKVAPVGDIPEHNGPAQIRKCEVPARYMTSRLVPVLHHSTHRSPSM